MWKKLVFFGVAGIAVLLTSMSVTRYFVTRVRASSIAQPFTAKVREDGYARGGVLKRSFIFTYAMRGDRSTATVFNHQVDPNGNPTTTKTIMDLAAKKWIAVDGLTASVSSTAISDEEVLFQGQQRVAQCATTNTGESGQVLGFPAYHVHMAVKGGSTMDTWEAPDLGCYPLKSQAVKDGAMVRREVLEVTLGEPDPSLFTAPAWPEMDPVTQDAEYAKRYGKRLYSDTALEKLQTLYRQKRR